MAKKKLQVEDIERSMFTEGNRDYISLTDIDRKFDGKGRHIENWLRNQYTVE